VKSCGCGVKNAESPPRGGRRCSNRAGAGVEDVSVAKFKLAVLGRFALSGPDGPIELPNKKLAGLLAYLACTAPVPQSREKLATLLWGSHFETQAQQNLRQAIYRLRRTLGRDAFVSDEDEISLAPGVVDSDAARLEALSGEGSLASLTAAGDLYRDRLLVDVAIAEEAWGDWVAGERQRLEGMALDALVRSGEMELALGHADKTLETAYRALAINNLREDAHRLILQALAAAGRKAEALKHYQDVVALLKRELSTEPDAATTSLVAGLGSTPPNRSPAVTEIKPALPQPDRASVAVLPFAAADGNTGQKVDADNRAAPGDQAGTAVRSGDRERRQLTIMVCNLVGSMPASARLDPEDMHDLIAAFHKGVADTVARFDGFVAQRLGDGAIVYFGYPAAHEHDAEQAVRAGFAILDVVGTLTATPHVTLRASIGIATGLVVVSEPTGTGDPRQHFAIGEAPTLAARLQAAASPGEIVIAAGTRRLVGRMFDCRPLPAIAANGQLEALEAWQVRGEAAGVSRFEARRTGALTPLVGRQEEIDLLLRRWDQAKLGEGRVVLLSGEPGIGKSRIAESLLARLEGELHARLRYFCSPNHTHSALYPFIAQLEGAARFEPGSSARAKLDTLEALLKPTATDPARELALIAELLAVPADERYPPLAVSPQRKREMTLAALLDQLDGVAAHGPVLIVFEDVHWIDPTSLDLLDQIVARVANLPVLLVATFRPEFQPTWVGQPHVTMLPLSRLGRSDSAGIIGSITQDKALPNAVIEQILSHTDGVPLFLEELTSTLVESGLLRETTDRYVLDGPLPPLAIPTTLQASLVARLDRLGSVKDVALIGAAIGREFSHQLIAAVSALATPELDAALERLRASGLISRRGTPPAATYSFKHALVRDAAYATMLKRRRQQLHATIAKVLVERFPALAESRPEVVAKHFTEAGLAVEAIDHWLKAGRLAHARWANREAVEFFEQALHVLEALPESRSTLEQGFEIRLELRPVLIVLGQSRRSLECVQEAETLAERLNDDNRRGWVCALRAGSHSALGELDEALATGARALEIAGRLGDLRLRVLATSCLLQAHYYRGEYEPVVALAAVNLAVLPADWGHETFGRNAPVSVFDRGWLIMSLAELGRFAEAAEPEAAAIRLAAPTQRALAIGWAYMAAGAFHLLRGDWARAHPTIEQAIAVMRAGDVDVMLDTSLACSAWVLGQLGEASEGLNRLREGERRVERQAERGFVGLLGPRYRLLGRAAFALGRLDEAQRLGEVALESLPRRPGWAAHGLHLLGDVAAHPDRFDAERGEACYRQALALAEPRGMRPLVAHCHLGLGKLYRRTGTREQAREHLATATAMYREMDMPFWLEQAEAEMHQARNRH
jgi:class 3 adenylate cyclase/DNA-binding SARP family transcriptional activator